MDQELIDRLELAKSVALREGEKLLHEHTHSIREKHLNDFVTDLDGATEKAIIDSIREAFKTDGFFGEENGSSDGSTGRWIIDPIDGTVDFFRGIPNFTISIAYERELHNPILGVVYCPSQNELFYGAEGTGAWLNQKPIHVSDVKDPSHALLVVSPPHRHKELTGVYLKKLERAFLECSDIRSFGSAALETCYIASGRMDGYFEYGLGYYDFAGGWAILKEAGGLIEPMKRGTRIDDYANAIIASNGFLGPWLRSRVGDDD